MVDQRFACLAAEKSSLDLAQLLFSHTCAGGKQKEKEATEWSTRGSLAGLQKKAVVTVCPSCSLTLVRKKNQSRPLLGWFVGLSLFGGHRLTRALADICNVIALPSFPLLLYSVRWPLFPACWPKCPPLVAEQVFPEHSGRCALGIAHSKKEERSYSYGEFWISKYRQSWISNYMIRIYIYALLYLVILIDDIS